MFFLNLNKKINELTYPGSIMTQPAARLQNGGALSQKVSVGWWLHRRHLRVIDPPQDFERRDFDLLVFALLDKLEKLKSVDEELVMGTLSWAKPRYPYYVLCDTHAKTDKRRPVFFSY